MFFLLIVCKAYGVLAAPSSQLARRNTSGSGGPSLSPSIWVPIVVISLSLTVCALLCSRKNIRKRWALWRSVGDSAAESASQPNTTAMSATTQNARAANRNQTTQAAPATRRRPRRTASQISTKSLPAYNKDPGDLELVIYSGPTEEDEDEIVQPMNFSTTTVMSTIQEGSGYNTLANGTQSRISLAHTAIDDDSIHVDYDNQPDRQSYHTLVVSDESSSALLDETGSPRGEAPPYEAIDMRLTHNGPDPLSAPAASPEPQLAQLQAERSRRSGIFSFLMPRRSTVNPDGMQHSRSPSATSMMSSVESSGSARGGRGHGHSRSNGSSGSGFSFAFRALSRTRSNVSDESQPPLPPMIAGNPISAPLTHTAMRGGFSYPRSGPTPDQIKFISSREAFQRLGVPYGPDAVAHAASTSRLDLLPPPDFDFDDDSLDTRTIDHNHDTANATEPVTATNDPTNPSNTPPSPSPPSAPPADADAPMSPSSVQTPTQSNYTTDPNRLPPLSFRLSGDLSQRKASGTSSLATFETADEFDPQTPTNTHQSHAASVPDASESLPNAVPGVELNESATR